MKLKIIQGMNILILKTDIYTVYAQHLFHAVFDKHPDIIDWSIDMEDVDKVLRIVATENLSSHEVIELVRQRNFYCEELTA